MPVWLVTGATGFLGRHVLAALDAGATPGIQVVASGRRRPSSWAPSTFLEVDLGDPAAVRSAIGTSEPEVILHLAGRTPPAGAKALYRDNARATVHLLDALRGRGRPARVVLAGSAAELGPVPVDDLPVGEDYPCRPRDAYGRSKWLATAAGLAARAPLDVVVARVFNPIGPGLPASQAFGRFAARLAEPGPDPLRLGVGDLDARRDFVDVRDVARALVALAIAGRAGRVYHVGTGRSHRVGDGLDHLIRLSGRTVAPEAAPPPAARRGPSDSRAAIGRIVDETGWRPAIAWRRSLEDLWQEARARARLPLTAPPGPV
ncbi:MAG TPA: NAD-dependent epimerase/dehydratase family protein [Isosphaeraceae bacterium]|nr:NAD-dependent epimerase/dehydratase family protein [Isosphaeraceae bacterium]